MPGFRVLDNLVICLIDLPYPKVRVLCAHTAQLRLLLLLDPLLQGLLKPRHCHFFEVGIFVLKLCLRMCKCGGLIGIPTDRVFYI